MTDLESQFPTHLHWITEQLVALICDTISCSLTRRLFGWEAVTHSDYSAGTSHTAGETLLHQQTR